MFCEGFERKEAFLDYKNIGSKNRQIGIFPTGLVHDVWQKMNEKPNQPMKKKVSAIRLY